VIQALDTRTQELFKDITKVREPDQSRLLFVDDASSDASLVCLQRLDVLETKVDAAIASCIIAAFAVIFSVVNLSTNSSRFFEAFQGR
jgi:hypothetical protein